MFVEPSAGKTCDTVSHVTKQHAPRPVLIQQVADQCFIGVGGVVAKSSPDFLSSVVGQNELPL